MKIILFFLLMLAVAARAQTARESIGLGAGGGYAATPVNPSTGMSYSATKEPDWCIVGTNIMDRNHFNSFQCTAETKEDDLVIATTRNYGGDRNWKRVAIRNYGGEVTSGKKLYVRATRNGIYQYANDPIELWDCGRELTKTEWREKQQADYLEAKQIEREKAAREAMKARDIAEKKQAAKEKALQANQAAAEKGDAYGLLRMGERYRDGDGVDKDLTKAKDYLQRAADAGSDTAKAALEKLNQP